MTYSDIFRHINNPSAGLVPTEFLINFSNPLPKNQTDNLNNEIVDVADLWKELVNIGMRHPLNLRICLEKNTVRLETGNQRIRLFKKYKIPYIPTIIEIAKTPIGNPGNGLQLYPLLERDFNISALAKVKSDLCHPQEAIHASILAKQE